MRCTEYYDAKTTDPPQWEKEKGKGKTKGKLKNIDTENGTSKQGIIEHHRLMFMYIKDLEKIR